MRVFLEIFRLKPHYSKIQILFHIYILYKAMKENAYGKVTMVISGRTDKSLPLINVISRTTSNMILQTGVPSIVMKLEQTHTYVN